MSASAHDLLVDAARQVALAVQRDGGRAFIVGGWVRDRLLGRDSKDIDVEVFGVPADTLRTLDAAANRAREGLRVVEDFVRFLGQLYNREVTEDDTVTVIRFSQIVGTMF